MKSLVCNVFGMAMGMTCLALVLCRPTLADDEQPAPAQEEQVVVVKTDDGQTAEEQEVVVMQQVQVEKSENADSARVMLQEKLAGLPEEIQKKVQARLEAVKKARGAKQNVRLIAPKVEFKVIAPGEEESAAVEQSTTQKNYTMKIVTDGSPEHKEKHVAIAIAADGKDTGADGELKMITVMVKDGQVLVNGEPVKGLDRPDLKEGELTVEVQAEAKGEKDKPKKYRMMIVKEEMAAEGAVPHVKWEIQKAKSAPGGEDVKTVTVTPRIQAGPNAEIIKRLKSIEKELKQLRNVVEEMRNDRDDD